jgi:ATPase subunit of ABC transporter with duplicated ATPase domains
MGRRPVTTGATPIPSVKKKFENPKTTMILSVDITEKSFGSKSLFSRINFSIDDGEKVGLIGRNGVGKSTLFSILSGQDTDFTGEIIPRKGATLVATSQEYHDAGDKTVVEYILDGLPNFASLSQTIHAFPDIENPSKKQINTYSDALEEFTNKDYFTVEDKIREELKNFQLVEAADRPFASLSGGQKRLSEVIKIMHSNAHLALVDEPTNFMDYVAKNQFIDWLKSAPEAVVVITHDRDVLESVDRIIEIKDGAIFNFKGNYEHYLRENATRTGAAMTSFEITERRKENLKIKIIEYKRLKEKARNPATIQQFKRLEYNSRAELEELEQTQRPSFWIDRESVEKMGYKDSDRYEKYKARNVKLSLKSSESKSKKLLLSGKNLSIGYGKPLFANKNFELREGEALEFRGRNGAGKTTLIKALLKNPEVNIFDGETFLDPHLKIGIYEQEVDEKYFELKLPNAIEKIYRDKGERITDEKIRKLLADYLFVESDREILVKNLSGGQKARLQIISMLAADPQLLILDEPTSHLDLPSIEELETALKKYAGALLFVSHDNYFRAKLPHTTLEI